MNRNNYGNYPKKRVLAADICTMVISFLTALLVRYQERFWAHVSYDLYVLILIFIVLIQIIIFLVIDIRRKSIYEMDPLENVTAVIRDKTLVTALLILFLYVTKRGEETSRFVIGVIYVLSIIIDLAVRMLLKRSYFKSHPLSERSHIPEISYPYPDEDALRLMMTQNGCSEILIHRGEASVQEYEDMLRLASGMGIRTYAGLSVPGYRVRSGIACDRNGYTCIPVSIRREKFSVFGVEYAVSRVEEAVLHVIRHISKLSGQYICFSNTHTLVMAREDAGYLKVLNGSAITFADGNPIAKLQARSGLTGVERVAGPDFMANMFRDTSDGSLSHYFYGSSPETLEALERKLKERYPDIDIRGMYSPPYRELTPEEDAMDVARINDSGADIIWIGLGAPKQEKWMAAHKDRIKGVMMGVGAGFDFHAGTIRRAPVWVQKIGMEWLYRLIQDPGRLFKRYVITNFKFYWYRLQEALSGSKRKNKDG